MGKFEIVRLLIYIGLVYAVSSVSYWVSAAFIFIFFALELILFLMVTLKNQLDAVTLLQEKKVSTDFGFSTEEITHDEAELVDLVRDGDGKAAAKFLTGRCANKLMDFELIPEQVRVVLAQRLVNAVVRREEPQSWDNLLADK